MENKQNSSCNTPANPSNIATNTTHIQQTNLIQPKKRKFWKCVLEIYQKMKQKWEKKTKFSERSS